jgi:hypothetical protein
VDWTSPDGGSVIVFKDELRRIIEFLILYIKAFKDCNEILKAGIEGSHHVSKIEDT